MHNTSKQQRAAIAATLAAGIVLAGLILYVQPPTASGEEHAAPPRHADTVQLTAAQIRAAGIAILQAGPRTIHTSIKLPGEIRVNADRTAQVVPLLGGTVQAVNASIGQAVKRGAVLAVIASAELSDQRSSLLLAEQRLAGARTAYARERQLWQEQVSAEQDFIQARQAMEEAEIAHNNARQKLRALGATRGTAGTLNRYALRAPFDGVVVEKQVTPGQTVKADTVLFTVSDLSTVWADAAVPAGAIAQVRVDATVAVTASAVDIQATGKVAYVGALLGAQTRTAIARVGLPNPRGAWRPGLFVDMEVAVASSQRAVPVAVAASAIQSIDGRPTVFVRVADGFAARPVTLGRRDATHVEVAGGLAAGQDYAAANSFILKAELGKSSDAGH